VFHTTDIKPRLALGRPRPLPPTNDEIALAYFNIVKTYDNDALKLLVNMMIDRPHYLERIQEIAMLEEESPQLQLTTRQVFRVRESDRPSEDGQGRDDATSGSASNAEPILGPADKDKVILVPIALLEKGTLLDGFTVTDSTGCDLPTLSYNQTRGLLAYVIHAVIDILPLGQGRASGMAGTEPLKIAANLVTAICSPGPMKKKSAEGQAKVKALLNSVVDLPVAEERLQRIRTFCETLVDHYIIVAEVPVPAGGHVVLTYKQEISVDSSALSLINRLRSRVGLRYSTFDIPLNIFSLDVEAYHLEMDAGPMQYVFDHHLERMNSRERVTQDDLRHGASKPYVRLHYNSAGPAMHLYIRRQSDPAGAAEAPQSPAAAQHDATFAENRERLKSVVEFREIPPGALGASTVVSLMTAAIVGFFALTQIGQEPTGHTPTIIGSDIPALVIALPGFASLIIGSWLDLSHLRRASLTTYLSLAASVTLSVLSALYYLLDANKVVPGRISLSVSGSFVIHTDVGWLLLATAAVTCSLFLVRDVVSGSRYYFNQVKDRVKGRT
jgi:hypothetical protein